MAFASAGRPARPLTPALSPEHWVRGRISALGENGVVCGLCRSRRSPLHLALAVADPEQDSGYAALGVPIESEKPGIETADFSVVRTLLSQGRSYEQAVEAFEPYEKVREPNAAARDAMRRVAGRAMQRKKPAFLFVNNRLEGHAPTTIEAVADCI